MPADNSTLRRALLREILRHEPATSQEELRQRLASRGHYVAQTTVSRDLTAIGARKVADSSGAHYVLDEPISADGGLAAVAERMRLFVVSIEASGNLVVMKTPPGAAHSVAVALDDATTRAIPELLGTIAGDDTMFIAARPPYDGRALAARLSKIMETVP